MPEPKIIPSHTLSIEALTESPGVNPVSAVQYCVVGANGRRYIYGDQSWVAAGHAVDEAHPGGHVEQRTITITYGEWNRS